MDLLGVNPENTLEVIGLTGGILQIMLEVSLRDAFVVLNSSNLRSEKHGEPERRPLAFHVLLVPLDYL